MLSQVDISSVEDHLWNETSLLAFTQTVRSHAGRPSSRTFAVSSARGPADRDMQIFVKTLAGRTITVDVQASDVQATSTDGVQQPILRCRLLA